MLELWKAIIFGIVEGITEWLPISSTGHMILLNEFLTLNVEKSFWDMFLVRHSARRDSCGGCFVLESDMAVRSFRRQKVIAQSGKYLERGLLVCRTGCSKNADHYELDEDRACLFSGDCICCAWSG